LISAEHTVIVQDDECRRFHVTDGLLIIAALAAGSAIVRCWLNPNWCAQPMGWAFQAQPSAARELHYAFARGGTWTIPYAMMLTPALLVARARRPRPRLERAAQQPGTMACAAALLAMILRPSQEAFSYVLDYLTRATSAFQLPSPPFRRLTPAQTLSVGQIVQNITLEMFPFFTAPVVAVAVLVAWLVLWTNGRWRPERDWIDRAGRVLGVYWMALAVFTSVMTELWKYID
jgi:hypothetical protein